MDVIEPPSHLSNEARDFLRNPPPPLDPLDYRDPEAVAEARAELHPIWAAQAADLPGAWVSRSETVGGVGAVRFAASDDALDGPEVLLHVHGGSYIFGSPDSNAVIAVPIAQRTGLPVISIDYRLAPEHPCPAAIDDAVAAYEALTARVRVRAIFGESAGGGLAVATAVALRERGTTLPARIGLISPWVDLTNGGDTHRTLSGIDPDFPDPTDPPRMAAAYAPVDTSDPRASPLFADLTGLPPTLIQVGGREVLLSDSCRLDRALRRAGASSTLDIWDGLWHVWQLYPRLPESNEAMTELADFLMETR